MPARSFSSDPFYRLGRWVHSDRWLVIAAWASRSSSRCRRAERPTLALAGRIRDLAARSSRSHPHDSAGARRKPFDAAGDLRQPDARDHRPGLLRCRGCLTEDLRQLDLVARVTTHRDNPRQAAPDGHTAYAVIALRSLPEEFRGVIPRVQGGAPPERPGDDADRRADLLQRHPVRHRARPAASRDHLVPVRGAGAGAGLRLAGGGDRAGRRSAARPSS